MNTELRKDCPMRHENGNCLPVGGFCTAVNNLICEALHNAYYTGRCAVDNAEIRTEAIKEFALRLREKMWPFPKPVTENIKDTVAVLRIINDTEKEMAGADNDI